MASVSLYGSGSNVSTSNDADRVVSITTATDDLIVLVITATGMSAAWSSVIVTDSQAGGTYTRIGGAESLKNASADTASMWVRDSRVASGGACTVTADFVTNAVTHTGAGLVAHKVTGMSRAGTNAIRQSAAVSNQSAATTPTPVLAAAALTTNALIGYVHNASNPAGMTPRASWTELLDSGYGTPATGVETMSRNSGETASSIAWGGTSATAFGAGVVELDASSPGTTFNDTIGESLTAAQTFANTMTMPVTRSEGLTAAVSLADSGGFSTFNESLTESLTAAQSFAAAQTFANAFASAVAASDSLSAPVTLSINSFGMRAIQWTLARPDMIARSAWTGSRTIIAAPWQAKWRASVDLAALQGEAQVRALRAFLAQREGKLNPFRIYATPFAQNANTGVTARFSYPAGSTSMAISGYTTSLLDGQFVTVNNQLLCLTANQSGTVINFQPPLRQALTAGTTIVTARPYAFVHLSASSVGWQAGPRRMFVASLECEEAVLEVDPTVVPEPFDPLSYSPSAWWDGSDPAQLFQDSALTTATGGVGNPIGGWKDKSGSARNLLQATSSKRAALQQSGGYNEVTLDGVDDGLATASGQSWPATVDMFFVLRNLADTTFVTAYDGTNPGTEYAGAVQSGSAGVINNGIGSPTTQVNGTTVSPDTRGQLYTNLGSSRKVMSILSASMSFSQFSIGDYVGFEAAVGFSEILVYPTLSADQRTAVLNYLTAKWGV